MCAQHATHFSTKMPPWSSEAHMQLNRGHLNNSLRKDEVLKPQRKLATVNGIVVDLHQKHKWTTSPVPSVTVPEKRSDKKPFGSAQMWPHRAKLSELNMSGCDSFSQPAQWKPEPVYIKISFDRHDWSEASLPSAVPVKEGKLWPLLITKKRINMI